MRTLLSRTLVLAVLVAALPQLAHADFINVISQTYRIRGYGFVFPYPRDSERRGVVDYDVTSSSPISRHDTVTILHSPGDDGGGFMIDTNATGGVFASSAFVQADTGRLDVLDAFADIAQAWASITFQPLESEVILRTECPFFCGRGTSSLYDETAGIAVLEFGPFITSAEYHASLDLSHIYTIKVFSDFEGSTRLRLLSAPESESVLTFFALGLCAFMLTLRRMRISGTSS